MVLRAERLVGGYTANQPLRTLLTNNNVIANAVKQSASILFYVFDYSKLKIKEF